jgi:hypothetical protein
MTSNRAKSPPAPCGGKRIAAEQLVPIFLGAVSGLAASYIALVFGVHGGPAWPAALIDGPLILLYPPDDRGYLIVVLAGGAALYGAYGWLVVRPPRFLRRWAVVTIAALIHVLAAAVLLR